jgi:uncharacterized delta-60 repeat protein
MRPDGNMAAVGNMGAADIFIERFAGTTQNGTATLNFGQNVDRAANIITQPDGKIIVTGISTNGVNNLTVLARINPDGTFDTTFGPYGNGTLDIYDNAVLAAEIDLRSDGKILLAGTYPDGVETVSMFYLLNPDGSPDSTFGNGGIAYAVDLGRVTISDVKFQPDGKAVILANRRYEPDGTVSIEEQDVVLRRLNPDGSIDTGFGNGGMVIANTSPPTLPVSSYDPSGFENARELVIENSGNIVVVLLSNQVAANRISTTNDRVDRKPVVYLLRYGPSGLLLGKNVSKRLRSSDIYTPIQSNPTIRGAFEQPGKGIIVHGTETFSLPMAFLARYSSISAPNNANNFFDFNFDGGAEFGAYRPGTSGYSQWRLVRSQNTGFTTYEPASFEFGLAGDLPVPGDYDGDGIQDLAVFRTDTGDWFTRKIYLNNCGPMECLEQVHFGIPGDVPAPGDFDGDGATDRAVFRPSEGNWYILFSSGGWTGLHFGQNGDQPVTGDYDKDGKSDVAVIRRENGQIIWYILQSSNNQFIGLQFGLTADKAVPADYDGDGGTDIAVWRPSDGNWYSLSNYTTFSAKKWGLDGDVPVPADYDRDNKADVGVFRPSEGNYYTLRSRDSTFLAYQYPGNPGDIQIASAYVR